jgi:hypothetical protein
MPARIRNLSWQYSGQRHSAAVLIADCSDENPLAVVDSRHASSLNHTSTTHKRIQSINVISYSCGKVYSQS